MGRRQITQGAVATRKWVQGKKGRSIGELARASGIERVRLSRILSGQIVRVSANDAFAIEKATGGAIAASLFRFGDGEDVRKTG